MLGKFSEQIQINAPISVVWNLYGTLKMANFLVEKLPNIVEKVDLIEGHGGTGSVLQVKQIQINAPASEVWNLYGTNKFPNFVVENLPHIVENVELIEGNGGSGTLVKVSLPGNPPYKEKFVLVDDEKRVKEVEIVEGGFLDLGFNFYGIKFEVIEKDENSSIIKITIDFETKDIEKIQFTIGNFQALVAILKASKDYLEK